MKSVDLVKSPNDDIVGMKWKQQFGHIRLAQANSQHSSLNQSYLVHEAQLLDRHINHTQCRTVNRERVCLVESMKSIGEFGFLNYSHNQL